MESTDIDNHLRKEVKFSSDVLFHKPSKTKIMTLTRANIPSIVPDSLHTRPIEAGDRPPLRSVSEIRQQIQTVEAEIQGHMNLVAAASRSSRKGSPAGIDLNRLVANGRGPALEKAREKLGALQKELKVVEDGEKLLVSFK